MKKRTLTKALVLSLATTLTVGTATVSTYAADASTISSTLSNVSIPSISGYSIGNSSLDSQAKAALKSKATEIMNSGKYVDATKSTYVKFNGSPVQKVTYDGNAHGLSAEIRATIGSAKVADANMFYVGATEDGTYYASAQAPTQPGFYYVAAYYAGSNEYYPIIAYGIIVIEPAKTPDKPVVDPDPVDPTPTPDPDTPDPTPTPDPDTPDPTPTPDPGKDDPTPNPNPGKDDPTPNPGKDDPSDPGKTDPTTPDSKDNTTKTNTKKNTTATKTSTTAKKADAAQQKKAPKTADTANYVWYMVTLLAAGVVSAVTLMMRKRRK